MTDDGVERMIDHAAQIVAGIPQWQGSSAPLRWIIVTKADGGYLEDYLECGHLCPSSSKCPSRRRCYRCAISEPRDFDPEVERTLETERRAAWRKVAAEKAKQEKVAAPPWSYRAWAQLTLDVPTLADLETMQGAFEAFCRLARERIDNLHADPPTVDLKRSSDER